MKGEIRDLGNTLQGIINEHYPSCHYIGEYLAIITKVNIIIWKFSMKENNLSYKKFKTITSNDEISLYDLQINKKSETELDVIYVTKSPNGIFSIHLNSDQRKIDFNENIHGVAFLNDKTFLFRLEK